MNTCTIESSDVQILLPHLALYGLAAILEESGAADVRLGWTGGMQPRPWVTGASLTRDVVDSAVRDHATQRCQPSSWVQCDVALKGSARGLMSPRLAAFGGEEVWSHIQRLRHDALDALTSAHTWADLAYLANLGEPSYWSHNRQRQTLQDDGASRLEMQPRNQGSEFVGSRLRKVAAAVAARAPGAVVAGIEGDSVVDEIGGDRNDSRSSTGLAAPGPTDNALAWCALWGIGQLPTAPRPDATARTSGHLGRGRDEWFYTPVWTRGWRPAKARSILASEQLRVAATHGLASGWAADPDAVLTAQGWLSARGVEGVVRFPIQRFGSDNAPERRAMRGTLVRTAVAA